MIRRATYLSARDLAKLFLSPAARQSGASKLDAATSFAGYARFGLFNIFRLLGFGRGTKVLVPAYNCDVVPLVLSRLGIEPVYYGITGDFQVDFGTIRPEPGIKGLISVNYFGFSIDFERVGKFARENRLVWINDNAHGYASRHGQKSLATFGDFSVTSFRKILPSVNGAIVSINSRDYVQVGESLRRMNGEGAMESSLPYLIRTSVRNAGIGGRIPDYSDIHAFGESDLKEYRIHPSALRLLSICDEDSISARRRRLFSHLVTFLDRSRSPALLPVKGVMKDGNSPMVLPVRARTPEIWKGVLRASRALGIDVHTWPSMSQEAIERNYFGCVDMWRSVLCLPLHQDLDAEPYCEALGRILLAAESLSGAN